MIQSTDLKFKNFIKNNPQFDKYFQFDEFDRPIILFEDLYDILRDMRLASVKTVFMDEELHDIVQDDPEHQKYISQLQKQYRLSDDDTIYH